MAMSAYASLFTSRPLCTHPLKWLSSGQIEDSAPLYVMIRFKIFLECRSNSNRDIVSINWTQGPRVNTIYARPLHPISLSSAITLSLALPV